MSQPFRDSKSRRSWLSSLHDLVLQHGRTSEWVLSTVMLVFGLTLAMPGDTVASTPAFAMLSHRGIDDALPAAICCIVAALRITGLYINGAHRRTPEIRLLGSIMSGMVFAFLGTLIIMPYLYGVTGALSTGGPVYLVLAVWEIFSAYRATTDVAANRR